ncbi:MAG: hypothetical protein H7174_10770 [Flavobacterium sp.]|nr:hypothetical protein [Flavobacterium sp.]
MITTIFKKSSLINYFIVGILMFLFFLVDQFSFLMSNFSVFDLWTKTLVLLFLITTLVLTNFITKRNGLSRDSTYAVLFSFLFLIFFPNIFNNPNLVFANFLVLLAMRRLISLQSFKFSKEKIFDASLFIFFASLFYFWSILFLNLVFISIILHVSRDYRNWVLPFLAFFAVLVSFVFYALIFDSSLINKFLLEINYNFEINYFNSIFQNISFSLFTTTALFFVTTMFLTLSKKTLAQNSTFKKILVWFFIGIIIFIIAPNKSNEVLIFTFVPLSVMATSFVEFTQIKWQQELTLALLILSGIFCFFSQI